ncbi:hypothetical protein JYK14_00465 [Siccirubricoccus sp. KC 17139]|uniref:Integrase n=1 Tax=Siccirubricoccus soli TaxID=2899147 RepID=A0ABT1CYC0_9PROT|nr:hypothetical protein [Siccirubricoccus soli]MCO6414654.1 hypothetical protein [Siccirubricoccus soli]MCP2680784.1 hypothetical protein [Siccirubricoccus soli]
MNTAHEIAAVTGHKKLSEVELYTRAAEQAKMAVAGMNKIGAGSVNPGPVKLSTQRKKRGQKPLSQDGW